MKISDINDYRRRHYLLKKNKNLREIDEYFEYCLIENYESKLENYEANAVMMGNLFANLITVDRRTFLVSILFPKENFTVESIIAWLNEYAIFFQDKANSNRMLPQANEILMGSRFKNDVLILYQKGQECLDFDPDQYAEITEKYVYYSQVTNLENARSVSAINKEKEPLVYLDGEPLDEFPHLEFDRAYDNIVCNGTIICADYIEDYYGLLGFFRNGLEGDPIAFLHGVTSPVYIFLEEDMDGGTICVIEYEYDLAAEDF